MALKNNRNMDGVLKIMVVGSLPPPFNGTRVSLNYLTKGLMERADVSVYTVNTSIGESMGFLKNLWRTIKTMTSVIQVIKQIDVVTAHLLTNRLDSIGLIILIISRLWKRPFILRKFEGRNYLDYKQPRRGICRWVVNHSGLYLAQTKALVKSALNDGAAHVAWYPTNRPHDKMFSNLSRKREGCRKFVFLGRVNKEKGICELIESGERLGSGTSVDIFGPLQGGFSEETFAGLKHVRYCGIIEPEKVAGLLVRYDVVVLPTYHKGEGYPGIIIESLMAGLPIITTRWQALTELVDETCGLLVEPRNADELYNAMKAVAEDRELYSRLCRGVLEKSILYDSKKWDDCFVDYCRSLMNRK